MYDGAIILESLRVGTSLTGFPLITRNLSRVAMEGTSSDQPKVWTLLEFEVEDARAPELADALAEILDQPGWYADFHNDEEIFVVFPERVFRYRRGDQDARAAAQQHGRTLAIPEPQLDWTD
jgi:hypothetical protein